MSLKEACIVVSGAGSGIGLATSRAAVEAGAKVVLLDLHVPSDLDLTTDSALVIPTDVTDRAQVDSAVSQAIERFGVPTGLVASAAIDRGGPTHLVPSEDWSATLQINLTGTFQLCQSLLAAGLRNDDWHASFVCVSSPAAFVGFAAGENAAYSASKGGVSGLVRSLAVEYAARGIRVNAVVPGATETPLMWANVTETEHAAVRREVEAAIPLGRLAQPDDIAPAILWLLSDEARYVTGSHLVCDGGLLAKSAMPV